MALFSRTGNTKGNGRISFPVVLKEQAAEEGAYAEWIRNHRWNDKNEHWCRSQVDRFSYKPTIGILMQCSNPVEEFLRESFSSIFHQVYPFQALYIVDRGSSDARVRDLLTKIEQDPRVKVSYQAGSERDRQAIARIMKKAECELLLLMGAEDVIEPYTLFNMVAALQSLPEADFVYSDSDLLDEKGRRFDPQFKPVWAVGAHYPLGYYQHPVLMGRRLVEKLRGYERVSELMEEGTLLDEASNNSRYATQAAGMLYHARARKRKKEQPPEPVNNVFLNENLVVDAGDQIRINTAIRIRTEPNVPLNLLWAVDSLEMTQGSIFLANLAQYLKDGTGHNLTVWSRGDGRLRSAYEKMGAVMSVGGKVSSMRDIDAAFVCALNDDRNIPALGNIPSVRLFCCDTTPADIEEYFKDPAAILFPSTQFAETYLSHDQRRVFRVLPPAVEWNDIKLYKRQHGPADLRASLEVPKDAFVVTLVGPTDSNTGRRTFIDAAMQLLSRITQMPVHFFIVGEAGGQQLTDLEQLAGKSARPDHFHFIPQSDDPASSYPFFWVSDVCVSCESDHLFPHRILQAMAFKKPVIAPDVLGGKQLIEDGGNGYLIPAGSVSDLVQRLEELALNKELAETFGRRSQELIIERHQLKKTAAQLEQFLREAIVYSI